MSYGFSSIRVRYRQRPEPHGPICDYEWPYEAWKPARISHEYAQHVDRLPWPVRVVFTEYTNYSVLLIRRDVGALFWLGWLWVLRYRLRRVGAELRRRIVLTAMVWGLAYVPAGKEPAWSDMFKRSPYGSGW